MFKIVSVLFSVVAVQMTSSQVIRGAYPAFAAYPSEIAAASLAETAALATAAAANAFSPVATTPYTPVYEPICIARVPGLTFGLNVDELSASNGGGLRVKSGSPIPISGVSVESEGIIMEGPLAVTGQLPFLGVVALEGPLPAIGNGAVSYGCGDGSVGIISEGKEPVAPAYPGYPMGYPNALAPGFPNALSLAGYPANPGCAAVF